MNRNTEAHLTELPAMHLSRSAFDCSHSLKTDFNAGSIVPLYVDADILPGDTVEVDMAEIVRMATPIYPVMDNAFLDLYWFFVPHRLVWEHWKEFWGENDNPWRQTQEYEVPHLKAPTGGWAEGTIADYFNIPTYVDSDTTPGQLHDFTVNALPFRAYSKIIGDWFRDENLQYTPHIYTDDTVRTGSNGTTTVTDIELGGFPAKACKIADYFTKALPSAQKGPAVSIPLGTTAKVKTGTVYDIQNTLPMKMHSVTGTGLQTYGNMITDGNGYVSQNTDPNQIVSTGNIANLAPSNLYTDLSDATAATINQLRTAFAIQKYYETIGRSGSRYIEWIRGVFGVESSDARLQRSEYLGGERVPINVDQVLQTSSTDAVTPQGNTGAFSCTISNNSMFTKSFEEHGTLMCLAVVRTEHSYQQGLARQWSRKKWTDFYNPFFANLGEMPILNKEIYAQGTNEDDEAFGYQEAWADYRMKPNRVSGHMRSNSPTGSLDVWHYADDYSTLPTLSAGWIEETTANIDRTIAVSADRAHQFIGDFYFKMKYVRAMPVYSIPGLIDHV